MKTFLIAFAGITAAELIAGYVVGADKEHNLATRLISAASTGAVYGGIVTISLKVAG